MYQHCHRFSGALKDEEELLMKRAAQKTASRHCKATRS